MKAVLLLAPLFLLGACSTTSQQTFTDDVIQLTKAGCHLTVNLAANAGAVNPGSGVQFQGSADCPGQAAAAPVLGAKVGGEQAAPAASFLK